MPDSSKIFFAVTNFSSSEVIWSSWFATRLNTAASASIFFPISSNPLFIASISALLRISVWITFLSLKLIKYWFLVSFFSFLLLFISFLFSYIIFIYIYIYSYLTSHNVTLTDTFGSHFPLQVHYTYNIIIYYCIFICLFSVYSLTFNFIWHFPLLLLFGLFAPGLFVCAVLAAVFVSVFCLTDRQTFLHDRVCDLHRSVILRSVNHFGYRSRFKERVCFFLFQEFYCYYCILFSIFTFLLFYSFLFHDSSSS